MTSVRLVTPSRRALLRHCQAWARGDMVLDETSGRAALEGSRVHAALDAYAKGIVNEPKIAKRLRSGFVEASRWLDAVRPRLVGTEIAYRLDLETGASEPSGVTMRGYPDDGHLHGTADVVYVDEDGERVVRDWKSGRPSPATADQLEMLAVMCGARRAEVAYLDDWRVQPVTVRPWPEILDGLRRDVAKIADAWAAPSAACDAMYCPARKTCESYALDRLGAA